MTVAQVEALGEDQAAAALAAWVKAKRSELPQALAKSGSKAHARLAKKALYQLQSAGVAVAAEASAAPATPSAPEAKVEFESVLSMQLGSGERAFLAAVPIRGGGVEVFQGIVHDELGLAQFGSERSNRSSFRKHLDALRKDTSTRTMIVPFARLQLEVGRALTLTERNKTELETPVREGLSRLGITPADPDVVVPPLEGSDAANAADGAALCGLFEFAQWLPGEKELAVLSERVDALKALPLDEAKRTEKSEKLARELAAETFTPAVKLLYARRLIYAAEVLGSQGKADDAKRATAEARRLAHLPGPGSFGEQLFVKALPHLKPSLSAQLGLKPKT